MTERPSFLSAIVDLHLSTRAELEEALVRQLIYGGDLSSAILELGLVDEPGLGESLSRCSGVPYFSGPHPIERALTVLLGESKPGLLVSVTDGSVWVIAGDASAFEGQEAEISEMVGHPLGFSVDLPFRIEEAWAALGGPLSPRAQALLARFGARAPRFVEAPTAPVSLPPISELAPLPESADSPAAPAVTDFPQVEPRMESPAPTIVEARSEVSPAIETVATEPPPRDYAQLAADSASTSVVPPTVVHRASGPEVPAPRVSKAAPSPTVRAAQVEATERAHAGLLAARDRDAIFQVVLEAASGYFAYSALFAISGSEARGLSAIGAGTPSHELASLKIPLDLPSPFQRAVHDGVHQLTRLRASGLEGGVAHDLGRTTGRRVLLLPIVLRGRSVILLYGDQGAQDVDAGSIGEIIALGPAVAHAFERVLMERKRASMIPQSAEAIGKLAGMMPAEPKAPSLVPEVPAPFSGKVPRKFSLPSEYRPGAPEEAALLLPSLHAQAGARATKPGVAPASAAEPATSAGEGPAPEAPAPTLDVNVRGEARGTERDEPSGDKGVDLPSESVEQNAPSERHKARLSETPPASARPSIAKQPSPRPVSHFAQDRTDSRQAKGRHVETARVAVAPEARQQKNAEPEESKPTGSHEIAAAEQRTLDDPSFPSEGPRTWKGFPGSPHPPSVEEAPPPPVAPAVSPSAPPRSGAEPSPMSLAMTPRRIVSLNSHGGARPALEPKLIEAPAPMFTAPEVRSSGTMVSRRPLMDEPPEDGWGAAPAPKVSRRPVGPRSYDEWVTRLVEGDEAALDRLIDGGESAVASLIAHFPGPVREPDVSSGKASECGPVLNALVRLGAKATPFLTVRTADENPEVRRWATLALGELPSKEAAKAIAGRLLDTAPSVRRAALSSARRVESDLLARRTLRSVLEEMAHDVRLGTEGRSATIQAIADIREHEAVPALLQILGDRDRTVARSAQWALSVLTRQDFGSDFVAWQAFWLEHRNEPRMSWLIDALGNARVDLRRGAFDEIKALTGQDFGYHEELPEAERSEVQALVRTWWTRSGNSH